MYRAAKRQGYRWPSVCDGLCECGVCYMVVEAGHEHLSDQQPVEAQRLSAGVKSREPRARLACQTRISGDITVTRRAVGR